MQFILLFFIFAGAYSQTVREVHCPSKEKPFLVADPAITEISGSVLVTGTGDVLRWKNLEALTSGKVSAKKDSIKLFKEATVHGEVRVIPMAPHELPWDLQFYEIDGKKFLYGGVMSPLPDQEYARLWDDNLSRRIKVANFDKTLQGWVFKEQPVFGKIEHPGEIGHSYGHQIIVEGSKRFMLHEEITSPGITEILIRPMNSPFKAGKAKKIISVTDLKMKDSARLGGGNLLEGPRYMYHEGAHFIFFSTGDFETKNYATRIAVSLNNIEGPYKVLKNPAGDALDLTKAAEDKGLYGVGRAFPYFMDGKPWIIYHGAKDLPGYDHNERVDLERFERCLFVSPLEINRSTNDVKVKLGGK